MVTYSRAEAAERAGVDVDDVSRLVELGIVIPQEGDRLSQGNVRRVQLAESLAAAGIPLDGLAAAMRRGEVSLDFVDAPVYERFSLLSTVTFQELSDRTGVPVSLLTVMREAAGSALPSPEDLVRDDELVIGSFLEAQVAAGFRPAAIERLLRVQGDSLRRITETEADWWRTEVIEPARAAGKRPDDISATDFSTQLSELS